MTERPDLIVDHRRALDEPSWFKELMDAALMPGNVISILATHRDRCCEVQPWMDTLGIVEGDDPQPGDDEEGGSARPDNYTRLIMPGDRPPIPERMKRKVRQRCGFGCVICGTPLYHYDHIVPWKPAQVHQADNLVLLCAQHHDEKTRRLLPTAAVVAAKARPFNRQRGRSDPYDLHFSGDECEAMLGSNLYSWGPLADGSVAVPLIVDDTPLVLFRTQQGHLLLTVQLFDEKNQLQVQILDNQLVFSLASWDVTFEGQRLTVRDGPGDTFVSIVFEVPARVVIDRAMLWRNGIELDITSERLLLMPDHNEFIRTTITNCVMGFGIGDPPSLPGAIRIASSRGPYSFDPVSEERVRRFSP